MVSQPCCGAGLQILRARGNRAASPRAGLGTAGAAAGIYAQQLRPAQATAASLTGGWYSGEPCLILAQAAHLITSRQVKKLNGLQFGIRFMLPPLPTVNQKGRGKHGLCTGHQRGEKGKEAHAGGAASDTSHNRQLPWQATHGSVHCVFPRGSVRFRSLQGMAAQPRLQGHGFQKRLTVFDSRSAVPDLCRAVSKPSALRKAGHSRQGISMAMVKRRVRFLKAAEMRAESQGDEMALVGYAALFNNESKDWANSAKRLPPAHSSAAWPKRPA